MSASEVPLLAFVGAGSLGQTFASLLASRGHAVTLFATPRTAAEILERRHIRVVGAVDITVSVAPAPALAGYVGITTDARTLPAGCGLIFVTKAHQLVAAIEAVHRAWPAPDDGAAWVAGLQNGIVKDDQLSARFGAERVVGGATILGAQRKDDGEVRVTGLGMTYLGEFAGAVTARVSAAITALNAAGIPAEAPRDIRSVLWSKACNATGAFGVSMLIGPTAPLIFHDPDLMRAYLTLVRETAAIARAEGVAVGDYPQFPSIGTFVERPIEETVAAVTPPPPSSGPRNQPSMVQDYLAGRPMEVEAVFGDLVERAEYHGVAVPSLVFVRNILRALNRAACSD